MKKVFRLLFSIIGAFIGVSLVHVLLPLMAKPSSRVALVMIYVAGALICALIFYLLAKPLGSWLDKYISSVERDVKKYPPTTIIFGTLGVILGFLLAYPITKLLTNLKIPAVGNSIFVLLSFIIYIGFGILGWRIATSNSEELENFFNKNKAGKGEKGEKVEKKSKLDISKTNIYASPKILDTSVIIDGRILDIIGTDFIEGDLIAPEFVLEELQHIADSADDLKRQRGRRGLDIVKKIQESDKANLVITDRDYPDIKEVDSKLLKMATDIGAKILTNDYNLNKVADVQGITVLNINDLSNALKPVVIPGEYLEVDVIKTGKGKNQGVGYLDDGTMIVVEDGEGYIGQKIRALVTSVLQTSAGKMIFVRAD